MGTPKILMVLKYIIVISFIGISTYALYPFINGMGCDYRSQVDDENGSFYSTCKLGFVTTIAKNKQSNEVIEYHGLYGKTGHTIIFLPTILQYWRLESFKIIYLSASYI